MIYKPREYYIDIWLNEYFENWLTIWYFKIVLKYKIIIK